MYTFPQKLYRILEYADESPDVQAIISWQPHGRSFLIKDKKRLVKEVLPLFFATVQYDSFRRNLNHWGFAQIRGVNSPDNKSYYHDYFLRTRIDVSYMIKRVKDPRFTPPRSSFSSSSNSTKISILPFQEPKFHEMEWLPQIKNQREEKKEYYSTSSTYNSSLPLRSASTSTISSKSDGDMVLVSAPRDNHGSNDSIGMDKNDDLLKLPDCEIDQLVEESVLSCTAVSGSNNYAPDNSIVFNSSSRNDLQGRDAFHVVVSTLGISISSNHETTSFPQRNPSVREEAKSTAISTLSNVWDDKNWQQFLIEQYMLLPKDLSLLNSVFDEESQETTW
ncbi:hypothetical protein CTEN210_12130 [Chaetoceros tenuissimus]|uniref:HSF-type DNA-binding domain-containing protein n=1 Tax=Chaetoceros tenuissimus TaxID=426638 RepID=A0AAD3HA61_9STRA|nr:hypothetical protein CTEN210_12130 [Chaetoceros tenuissimus]